MKDPVRPAGLPKAIEEGRRIQRTMDDLIKPSATLRLIEAIDRATVSTKALDELARRTRLLQFTQTPAFLKAIEVAAAPSHVAEIGRRFELTNLITPKLPEILKLSEIVAARVRPFENIRKETEWSSILSDRMARISDPWAIREELEGSTEAFARLSRLSDVARAAPVYADRTTEALVDELGQPSEAPPGEETIEQREKRYDVAGRERQLIAFPPTRYSQILISAGYAVSFPPPPKVAIEEGLIEPVQFSPETGYLIQSLEAHLRQMVVSRLHALDGDAWIKRRVPETVRLKWNDGRSAAKLAGKPVLAPIHYANFMDLADVITAGNNWSEFQAAFKSKENLRVSLQRLYFIRNDVSHSRPISMTDKVVAVTEGTMLFRALGLTVTYED